MSGLDEAFPSSRLQGYTALLRAKLSKKRFTHSMNVAESAKVLAQRYNADADWAYLAGLLHDICKELPFEEQSELMQSALPPAGAEEWECKPVWHGIAAESYLRMELGIENQDVLHAVRFHTVGRAGMSRLEEIIYMADLISADRTYRDVEHFRKLAMTDLERAMFEAMQYAIDSSLRKGNLIVSQTMEAYNHYLRIMNQRRK